ncbi:MAG: PAS domain S-box protein [Pseudomonadota bacterium]
MTDVNKEPGQTTGREAQMTTADAQRLIHELRVHQIELEMQNEELRRTQQALARERARYFDLYDLAPVGYCTITEAGLIQQANLTAANLLDVARSALVQQPVSRFVFREDQDIYYRHRKLLLESEQAQSCELRLLKRDGSPFWTHMNATLAQDDDGAPTMRVVLKDISLRKQHENQMHIQSLVLDQIQEHVTVTDLNGVVLFVNQIEERALSQSRHAGIGKHVSAYGHGPLADATQEEIVRITRTQGAWQGKVQYLMADGSYSLRDLRTALIKDEAGQAIAMVGIGTDITARYKAEEVLRQREQYQRALLDNFPFMVWLKDDQSSFLAVNKVFATRFGWPSPQSLIGCNDFDIVPPERAMQYRADDQAVLASGTSRQVEEMSGMGEQYGWVETYKSPITVDGRVLGTVGFARDITVRKRTEAALISAMAESEKANHAKSRFLAAASHDLRQPLAALALYVGVLKNKTEPDQAPLVDKIQDCVDNLSKLLTDLLDLSKLDAGVIQPKPTDFAIKDLMCSLMTLHCAEAESKGLRLRGRPCGVIARTDPTLLRRILDNLLANAIRYTQQGGVLIACRRHQGKLWIEVWDTGIGIAPDQTGIIFEEFRQLGDDARNRGSGLGLAIVAKMANLLGLQIRLRSQPGRGSMFAIELPEVHVKPPEQAQAQPVTLRSLRIAVVDDNPLVLHALALSLESHGHQVVAALTIKELLERLGTQAPDIIISDYRLTDAETGFDAIRATRERFGADLPALIITGDTDPTLIRSMVDRGISVHYKPLQIDVLQALIMDATEQR